MRSRIQLGTGTVSWILTAGTCVAPGYLNLKSKGVAQTSFDYNYFSLQCKKRGALTLLDDFSCKVSTNMVCLSCWSHRVHCQCKK